MPSIDEILTKHIKHTYRILCAVSIFTKYTHNSYTKDLDVTSAMSGVQPSCKSETKKGFTLFSLACCS